MTVFWISFMWLLFLVLLGLRLGGVIGWSWWWVTAPLWAMPSLLFLILVTTGIFVGLVALLVDWSKK